MNKLIARTKYAVLGFGCILISFFFLECSGKKVKPKAELSIQSCAAPASWFSGPNVPKPNPEDSLVTNCDFHKLCWQYFLWLTEKVAPGKLRFQIMYSSAAINPDDKNPRHHVLGGVQQAESNGILVDKNGRAVYTSLIINDVYRNWVIKNKLYDPNVLLNFPDTSDFPVGSLSLKAAWKIVEPGEDVSKFYTTTADIELLENVNGKVVIPAHPKIQKNVKVALIGFHIAIVTKDHPEFIWATFEQVDNAPNFKPNQEMNKPVSDSNYTFYNAGTIASDCNQNNAAIIKLDEATQKLTPISEVARQYRVGGGSNNNQHNIDMLNKSVHSQLKPNSMWQNYMEVGAVWFNTSKGVLVPNWTPNSDSLNRITGSIKLSNSTIETFTQNIRSQDECFSCHNTTAVTYTPEGVKILPGKNLSTSHILLRNYLGGMRVRRN